MREETKEEVLDILKEDMDKFIYAADVIGQLITDLSFCTPWGEEFILKQKESFEKESNRLLEDMIIGGYSQKEIFGITEAYKSLCNAMRLFE